MSLKDLQRNGRVLSGPFSRPAPNDIHIIGQKAIELTWQQIGLVSITEPILNVEGAPDNPNYIVTVGGVRTDKQMIVSAVAITPEMVAAGPAAIIQEVGLALNQLHTYRTCGCPSGNRCEFHTPPTEDEIKNDVKPTITEN